MRKILIKSGITLIFSLFTFTSPYIASSAHGLEFTYEDYSSPQDYIVVKLKFDSVNDFMKSFDDNNNLKIKFDKTKLTYEKCNFKGSLSSKNVKVDKCKKNLNISLDKNCSLPQSQDPQTIELIFKTKNKGEKCETPILVSRVKENPIKLFNIPLKGNPSAHLCRLASLIPSFGTLTPSFNSETFDYNLTVEHDVKTINFDAKPLTDNLKVKINRKKLLGEGKYTDILITVSNPELKIKKIYKVRVYRQEKPRGSKSNNLSNIKSKSKDSGLKSSEECDDHNTELNSSGKMSIPSKNLSELEYTKEFLRELENTNFPSHKIETNPLNENSDFRKYLAITLLTSASGLALYLIFKNIHSIKKSKNLNLK